MKDEPLAISLMCSIFLVEVMVVVALWVTR